MAEQHAPLLHEYLSMIVAAGGSDLHLHTGLPPYIRRNGKLMAIPDTPNLSAEQISGMMLKLTERVPAHRAAFKDQGEADLSYELPGVARYRVNVYRERGKLAMTLRVIPQVVPHIDDIGVPDVLKDIALEHHGLILVTGATGSGKTTTLAAMIDYINRNRHAHILTIEDPIEIMHPNHCSLISQREVGSDTGDFQQALRRALRQDPDVILIGEIRDEETMRTALAAAETGHLVMATLHTINATETISRVLDLFPSDAQMQARAMLAGALKAVVSQRLARTVDDSRSAVVEVMINTSRIADCITNPDETSKLEEAIAEGEYYGMQTFDQALIRLIMNGTITEDEALHHVSSPQNFRLRLESTKAQANVEAQRAAEHEAHLAQLQAAAEAAEAAAAAAAERAMMPPAPLPSAIMVPPAGYPQPQPVDGGQVAYAQPGHAPTGTVDAVLSPTPHHPGYAAPAPLAPIEAPAAYMAPPADMAPPTVHMAPAAMPEHAMPAPGMAPPQGMPTAPPAAYAPPAAHDHVT